MIPLRPTINLYYDKIIDDTPIPNGVSHYDFTNDIYRIPVASDKNIPVHYITEFFNVMKALEVPRVNLFSGKETAKNLFYPLELAKGRKWDTDLSNIIPPKTFNKIKKGAMKLLILAPRLNHDYRTLWKLRERLDFLQLPREQVYIVLGDLNRCYKKLFDNTNVYGIDWWQIYAQLAYKSRLGYKNYSWVFMEKPAHRLKPPAAESEDFKLDNWEPKRIFTAFTGVSKIHNTAFVSELIYRKLDRFGKYSFNLEKYEKPKNHTDFRITDKSKGEEYIEAKKQIIQSLAGVSHTIDFSLEEINKDPLLIKKEIFEDSLLSIVGGSYSPMLDHHYMDETNVIAPGLGIWRQIAKGHPFMSLGCLNTMGYISNEGYFLPTPIINQHYDRVSRTPEKVKLMCDNIEMLSSLTDQEIKDKVNELKPFMKKNTEKFFDKPNKRKFEKLFGEMAYE